MAWDVQHKLTPCKKGQCSLQCQPHARFTVVLHFQVQSYGKIPEV